MKKISANLVEKENKKGTKYIAIEVVIGELVKLVFLDRGELLYIKELMKKSNE